MTWGLVLLIGVAVFVVLVAVSCVSQGKAVPPGPPEESQASTQSVKGNWK